MAKSSYRINMCEGSILPKVLLFAIPLMISSILQLLFNAADVIVVGQFAGSQSLAAVSSTGSLVNLIINLFVGLSIGTNVMTARYMGAGNNKDVHETVHTSIYIAMIGGLILACFGFFAASTLLSWMDTPSDVLPLSSLYLKIYFLGMPASMLYNFGSSILRAQGDTKRPLYYLSLAGVLNVVMNLFFVIVLHMDVAGVALATILSQYVSAILVILCLIHESGSLRLYPKQLKIYKDKLLDIAKIGLPAGIQGTVFSLSNVVIQSSVNSFGSIVMAGNGAASNIEGFVYSAMNAFYQACLTFTGQNIGAKKLERVNRILFVCQMCVITVGVVMGVSCYINGRVLLGIYSNDAAVIDAGMIRLKYVCLTYFLCGIMDVFVGSLRGMGYSIMPMIVSLLGACAMRLVWIATIFQAIHTLENLYISYPISWIITLSVHFICFVIVRIKLGKKMKQAA